MVPMIFHTFQSTVEQILMGSSIKETRERIHTMSRTNYLKIVCRTTVRMTLCNRKLSRRTLVDLLMELVKTLIQGLMTISSKRKPDWKTLKSLMMKRIWIKSKETKPNSNIIRCSMIMVPRWNGQLRLQVQVLLQAKLRITMFLRSNNKILKTLSQNKTLPFKPRLSQLTLTLREKVLKSWKSICYVSLAVRSQSACSSKLVNTFHSVRIVIITGRCNQRRQTRHYSAQSVEKTTRKQWWFSSSDKFY